jgi:formylglycine-generating enzyme required for sulfatase activity
MQHQVTLIQPFFLTHTEVTFTQYDAFARATGRDLPGDSGWGRADRPVINVDWWNARAYARWLGAMTGTTCRLPSEAEWEYACRAGNTKAYAVPADTGGSDDIAGQGLANCKDCGSQWDGKQTAPVRQFRPNSWNLYDMHGNVFEWVEDCWHEGYGGAPETSQDWLDGDGGQCGLRVLRGGSWGDDLDAARCANRDWGGPVYRDRGVGFRVVCLSPIVGH